MTVINPWEDSHLDCIASAQIKLGFFSQKSSKFLHIFLKELWTSLSFYRYICTFIYGYIHTVSRILLWREGCMQNIRKDLSMGLKIGLRKQVLYSDARVSYIAVSKSFYKKKTLFCKTLRSLKNTECSLNIVFPRRF